MDPTKLKYAKTHEWVNVDGDAATVGITDFAVKQLTDLVFIELPPAGRSFQAGQTFGEVESVKAVSDLYAPVAGVITEANNTLVDDLSPLSEDPFGKGWMIRMKVSDASALGELMDLAAYESFCQSAEH